MPHKVPYMCTMIGKKEFSNYGNQEGEIRSITILVYRNTCIVCKGCKCVFLVQNLNLVLLGRYIKYIDIMEPLWSPDKPHQFMLHKSRTQVVLLPSNSDISAKMSHFCHFRHPPYISKLLYVCQKMYMAIYDRN